MCYNYKLERDIYSFLQVSFTRDNLQMISKSSFFLVFFLPSIAIGFLLLLEFIFKKDPTDLIEEPTRIKLLSNQAVIFFYIHMDLRKSHIMIK